MKQHQAVIISNLLDLINLLPFINIDVVLNYTEYKSLIVHNEKSKPSAMISFQLKEVVKFIDDNNNKKLEIAELTF